MKEWPLTPITEETFERQGWEMNVEKDEGEGELSYDEAFIKAADLGYCDLFQFTCAAARTCDAWKSGGPITKG